MNGEMAGPGDSGSDPSAHLRPGNGCESGPCLAQEWCGSGPGTVLVTPGPTCWQEGPTGTHDTRSRETGWTSSRPRRVCVPTLSEGHLPALEPHGSGDICWRNPSWGPGPVLGCHGGPPAWGQGSGERPQNHEELRPAPRLSRDGLCL